MVKREMTKKNLQSHAPRNGQADLLPAAACWLWLYIKIILGAFKLMPKPKAEPGLTGSESLGWCVELANPFKKFSGDSYQQPWLRISTNQGLGRGEGRFLYSGTALGLNCPCCQEPQWNLNTWRHCWLSSTKGKLYSVYTLSNIPNKWRQGNYVFFKNCLRVTFCCK